MKIGTWLLAMVEPLLGRILTSLGFSVVSIVGFDAAVDTLKARLVASVNAMPLEALQVFLLAGGGTALSIITGAVATRMLLWQITSATKILGANPQ